MFPTYNIFNLAIHKRQLLKLFVSVTIFLAAIQSVQAQESKTETMTIMRGETFEVFAVHDFLDPSFSWSLTKDGNLIQSSTQQIFRTRIREQGNYVLVASIYNSELTKSRQREFLIRSTDTIVSNNEAPLDGSTSLIKSTQPRPKNGKVIFGENTRLLRIEPNQSEGSRLTIDTNINIDDDADGNPKNDSISDTLLFTSSNTPLYLWFTEPVTDLSIAVFNESSNNEQILRITNLETAQLEAIEEEKKKKNNPEIIITEFSKNTIGFGLDVSEYPWGLRPLLLLWNFGDGMQSLLDRPIHTYNSLNDFNVQVKIRDLETNEELQIFKKIITITELEAYTVTPAGTGSISSSVSSQGSSKSIASSSTSSINTKDPPTESSGTIWLLLKLFGVGLGSVLVGLLLVVIVHFIKKKVNVQDILTKSEEKLLKPNQATENNELAPMALPVIDAEPEADDTPPDPIVTTPKEAEQPPLNETVTPSWLNTDPQSTDGKTVYYDTTNENNPDVIEQPTQVSTEDVIKTEASTGALPEWLQPTNNTTSTTDSKSETNNGVNPEATTAQPNNEEVITTEAPVLDKKIDTKPEANNTANTKVSNGSIADAPLPAWLQPNSNQQSADSNLETDTSKKTSKELASKSTNLPTQEKQANTPITSNATQTKNSTSADLDETEGEIIETDNEGKIPPDVWATLSAEQKEQEKKRQKRKRYRQNKKSREEDTPDVTVNNSKSNTPSEADAPSVDTLKSMDSPKVTEVDAPKKTTNKTTEDLQVTPLKVSDNNNEGNTASSNSSINTPDWLQNGIQKGSKPETETKAVQPIAIEDTPKEQTQTINTLQTSQVTTPNWLQAGMQLPTKIPDTNTEQDAAIEVENVQTPDAKPTIDTVTAPSWLQTGMQQADAEGQSQTSAPPKELQDTKDGSDDDVQFIVSADSLDDKS